MNQSRINRKLRAAERVRTEQEWPAGYRVLP